MPRAAQPTTTRIATPAGVTLAVHQWAGVGAPVLLAHATGFHGLLWQPIAQRLVAAGRTVYSFDFRGHGDSTAPDEDYAWGHFADDVLAVVDHLQLGSGPLVAAGHSKGAAALLLAELARPTTFAGIWVYEPVMMPADAAVAASAGAQANNSLASGARRRRNEWPSPGAAYESYSSKPPLNVMTPESLHAYVDYGLRDRGDGVFELKCQPEVEGRVYSMAPANGLFEQLQHVASSVRVVCGEQSWSITPDIARAIVSRLPNGSVEIWEGHGHFGPQADPDRAAESILAFATR